jgi:hypothetical protein
MPNLGKGLLQITNKAILIMRFIISYLLFAQLYGKFSLSPMWVLAPRLHTLDGSARPPINTTRNFPAHVSAESPLNTSSNPSKVTIGQLFKIPPSSPKIDPIFSLGWNPNIFVT